MFPWILIIDVNKSSKVYYNEFERTFWVVTTLEGATKKTKTNMDLGRNKVIQLGFKFWIKYKLGFQTKFHNVNEGIDYKWRRVLQPYLECPTNSLNGQLFIYF